MPPRPGAAPLALTQHQRDAVYHGRQNIRTETRGLLVGACGSGKTLVSIKIAEEFDPAVRSVLVAVPTRLLLKQAIEDWQQSYDPDRKLEIIAVCSDKSVKNDITSKDLNKDLESVGVTVTTSAEELRERLRAPTRHDTLRLVVTTYQSTPTIARAVKGVVKKTMFDYLIADEAHHVAGQSPTSKKGRAFQTVLDDTQIRAARRLFLTATPRVVTPPRRDGEEEHDLEYYGVESKKDVFSMDDEEVFGPVFYEMTLAQAIEDPEVHVAPYRLLPLYIRQSSLDHVTREGSDLPHATIGDEDEAAALFALEAFTRQQARDGGETNKVITYHERTDRAKSFEQACRALNENVASPDQARFAPGYLDGSMKMDERRAVLDEFTAAKQSEVAVLSNCQALTEGINVDGANTLMFADPKGSPIEVMQAIGRIIRTGDEEDKVGTVIVPLIVDDVTNETEHTVTEASVKRLRRVLFAAKHIDARVAERIEIPAEPLPPHSTDTFGAENEGEVRIRQQIFEARHHLSEKAVRDVVEAAKRDVLGVTGREYYGVKWNERSGQWKASLRSPWADDQSQNPDPALWGTRNTIDLGEYPDAEAAAAAVDAFLVEHQVDRATNFGRNPHYIDRAEASGLTPRFESAVSFSPKRGKQGEHRAYIDLPVYVHKLHKPDEKPKQVKINRYWKTEKDAVLCYDALAVRFGFPERVIMPDKEPDLNRARIKKYQVEEGIEREPYFPHLPERNFWAYVEDPNGRIQDVGSYRTKEEARAAREAALAAMQEAAPDADMTDVARKMKERLNGILVQAGVPDGSRIDIYIEESGEKRSEQSTRSGKR